MKSKLLDLYGRLPVIRDLLSIKAELNHRWPYDRLMASSSAIRAIEAIKAGNERYRDPRRLLAHGTQYFSQNFEDGMIAEIFRRIGTTNRIFLEIGVGNGSENNTSSLLSAGWSGFWIEGDAECVRSIEAQLLKMPKTSGRLKVRQAFVSPDNIAYLLSEMGVPKEIDLFSLDIDLNTYHIWDALESFRPRIVVVEYNAAFPPGLEWIHPYSGQGEWDYSQEFGASLKAYELLGRKYGYSLVGCDITGINAFFVRNELMEDHFEGPHTAENHYEPPRYYLMHRYAHPSKFYVENSV